MLSPALLPDGVALPDGDPADPDGDGDGDEPDADGEPEGDGDEPEVPDGDSESVALELVPLLDSAVEPEVDPESTEDEDTSSTQSPS